MFCIKHIKLQHFKNYQNANLALCNQVNCFVGKNGAGKTNFLDSVYYLSFTKSYFGTLDAQNMQPNAEFFTIKATYLKNTFDEETILTYHKGKKTLTVNHNEVKKFSEHIGYFPLVIIAPNDIMLLYNASDERRKFLDGLIAQTDKVYLNDLLCYNKVLEQRNKQLKLFAEQGQVNTTLLESYNNQLTNYGKNLFAKRSTFLTAFIPLVNQFYQKIAASNEHVEVAYTSDLLNTDFSTLLVQYQQTDIAAQRTTKGIHKDDLAFSINGHVIKKFGSQGQQKSLIIALKLAQYHYLKQHTNTKPLLLLDDIFEKLDEHRLKVLLQMIVENEFGQIFITDSHLNRLQTLFNALPNVVAKYFTVNEGNVEEILTN